MEHEWNILLHYTYSIVYFYFLNNYTLDNVCIDEDINMLKMENKSHIVCGCGAQRDIHAL